MQAVQKVESVGVEVQDLWKRFGTQDVLKGVSFTVAPGEIFVLMGPSGSGKSVLLRHLAGLMTADRGEVIVDGRDAALESTRAIVRMAMVFQAGALFNSMRVYDNLALYHREHRTYSEAALKDKVGSVMRALSIEAAADKTPAELSGGMKKRVAVARAILMDPQLILYDEPTSELDPILAATTSELIATVSRETAATSLVVTHDRELALAIGDKVGLLMGGVLKFLGTPSELKACEDAAVREFMAPQINLEQPRFRQKETNS